MRQLIPLGIFLILVSCGQTEVKEIISTYDNGEPEVIFFYKVKGDTLTYRKERFFKSGKCMYTGHVIKGVKDGVWTWWYENGNKKDQCKYKNGFYADTVYHWFSNGQLSQIEIVPENKISYNNSCSCNGTIIRYFESGRLKEQFNSVQGKIIGKYRSFDENGGWDVATYKDGIMHGDVHEHNLDSTGDLSIVIGQYNNGKEHGQWKWLDRDSLLLGTREYHQGELSGRYFKYYHNGKIEEEGNLVKGLVDGLVKFYDEEGKLVETQKYKLGEQLN